MSDTELHIPEWLNYECTGCGKCCGGWAVPLTDQDYQRLDNIGWTALSPLFPEEGLFRPLKDKEMAGTPYSHAIKPNQQGRCPFLVDNLCFIHRQFGAESKPAICQLYPYSFNQTPSGVYVTVKFDSLGVLFNSGRPLSQQRQELTGKWSEYRCLFPHHKPNWSAIKLVVGEPLGWQEYLEHESKVLEIIQDRSIPLAQRLLDGSGYLMRQRSTGTATPGRSTGDRVEGRPLKRVDRGFLLALYWLYFPAGAVNGARAGFNLAGLLEQIVLRGDRLEFISERYSLDQLGEFPWPEGDAAVDDLLFRFFYSHIFGKSYFGAGFGQLSLVAGFHHLICILAVIKLRAKASALYSGAERVTYLDVAQAIAMLEKHRADIVLTGYSAAVWELLLASSSRMHRLLAYT